MHAIGWVIGGTTGNSRASFFVRLGRNGPACLLCVQQCAGAGQHAPAETLGGGVDNCKTAAGARDTLLPAFATIGHPFIILRLHGR